MIRPNQRIWWQGSKRFLLLPFGPIVSMSLRRLFLGELLSSRARLRFTGCAHYASLLRLEEEVYIKQRLSSFCRVSLMGTTSCHVDNPVDTSGIKRLSPGTSKTK